MTYTQSMGLERSGDISLALMGEGGEGNSHPQGPHSP